MILEFIRNAYISHLSKKIDSETVPNKFVLRTLHKLAKYGAPTAYLRLGEIYLRGEIVPRHLPTGMLWLKKAGNAGYSRAWGLIAKARASGGSFEQIGDLYTTDDSAPIDLDEVLDYAIKGMEGGDIPSAGFSAQILLRMRGLRNQECRKIVLKAAQMGDPWSQALASRMASEGITAYFLPGMTAQQSAIEWCHRSISIEIQDPFPYLNAARLMSCGIVPGSSDSARKLMKRAADLGHNEARTQYGYQLLCEGNTLHGVSYLQKAFWAGSGDAATILGNFYLKNLESENSLAVKWYIRAAKLNHAGAIKLLSDILDRKKLNLHDRNTVFYFLNRLN
ncbi:SEL1-like repeat protein [Gluconobacter cerinus]|uniref:SEL1-like repeat protein n=1 Tax=Gluconobacter TaxID=441 RepID=UPI001B8ADCEA|nr:MULTISPECIES: SEL1-like repeat protein [Gluconobacter]MBS0994400.1 SEL1-like repeat protein [Gluconobacter cerinus]MBS1022114.1 SEL1-like repeat protein [Gluconobacter cerinus]